MQLDKEIIKEWAKLRSSEDSAIIMERMAQKGCIRTQESVRNYMSGSPMPPMAAEVMATYYMEKAIQVAGKVEEFQQLMKIGKYATKPPKK